MRLRSAFAAAALVLGSVVAAPAAPAFASHKVPCGKMPADYVGTFAIEGVHDVAVEFKADGTLVQRFFGMPVGEGTHKTGYGWIIFEVGGEKVVSIKVECADPCAGRVTRFEAVDSFGEFGAMVRG
ncbi:hypothetical protein [Yinghuangia soli]|uniref:Uncharacterized protein n=1 Tax=Yinghuangia soli TaxID=2908204 RepID=A0AA41PZZ4_9ACTN|nr:hypothetical protein [Yinghuangia soli]MCF2527904.1 hypothetical protein [Yinghuangia soli]